jgi:hypothetical protein
MRGDPWGGGHGKAGDGGRKRAATPLELAYHRRVPARRGFMHNGLGADFPGARRFVAGEFP